MFTLVFTYVYIFLIHVSISSFLVSALSIAIVLVTSYFSFVLFIVFHHDMICNIYIVYANNHHH